MNHTNNNRLADPETLLQCPYDNTHMIRVKRWQPHIIKCRRNHVTQDFRNCPFNAKHEVPAVELPYHIQMCPDQVVVHEEILHKMRSANPDATIPKGNTDMPPLQQWASSASAEDWDGEFRRNPVVVDPTLNSTSLSGIGQSGFTPSQRREHRKLLKQLNELEKRGESTDEVRAQLKAFNSAGPTFRSALPAQAATGTATQSVEPEREVERTGPRMPRAPPQVDLRAGMGVRTGQMTNGADSAQRKTRIAAVFGRGGAPPRDDMTSRPGRDVTMVDQRVEILAKLAAGRGVAKPK